MQRNLILNQTNIFSEADDCSWRKRPVASEMVLCVHLQVVQLRHIFECYDTKTDSWQAEANTLTSRCCHGSVEANGFIFVSWSGVWQCLWPNPQQRWGVQPHHMTVSLRNRKCLYANNPGTLSFTNALCFNAKLQEIAVWVFSLPRCVQM